MSETSLEPFTTDNYFEQYDKLTALIVKGHRIIVASERLADALSKLPEQRRTVLLMYFFLGYTDTEIGCAAALFCNPICQPLSLIHF